MLSPRITRYPRDTDEKGGVSLVNLGNRSREKGGGGDRKSDIARHRRSVAAEDETKATNATALELCTSRVLDQRNLFENG